MASVSVILWPRLRRKRGNEPASRCHAPNRLAYEQLLVGGLKRRGVCGRDLLLPVTELGVVLLERDVLRLERRSQLVDIVLGGGHRDRGESQSRIHPDEHIARAGGERELVLER